MPRPDPDALDKLRARIQALRAKTTANGCTEDEALAAAAKVAELLDRYELTLDEVALRAAACEMQAFEPARRKRIPLDDCIAAIAAFYDCRAWRERAADGAVRHVFFGLPADAAAAQCLAALVDEAVRTELGRYKTTRDYARFRHQERHLANASFALGMVASIADRLEAMRGERDGVRARSGRDLMVRKSAIVDAELARLRLDLRTSDGWSPGRLVAPEAYDAGTAAGAALPLRGPDAEAGPAPVPRRARRG
jgi:hypothetical protein